MPRQALAAGNTMGGPVAPSRPGGASPNALWAVGRWPGNWSKTVIQPLAGVGPWSGCRQSSTASATPPTLMAASARLKAGQ